MRRTKGGLSLSETFAIVMCGEHVKENSLWTEELGRSLRKIFLILIINSEVTS